MPFALINAPIAAWAPPKPARVRTIAGVVIAYRDSARYRLGTHRVSVDELQRLQREVEAGRLIGSPVWAYVHGATALRAQDANPFTCPWDSGRSGTAYMTTEAARERFGRGESKRLTKTARHAALIACRQAVAAFSNALNSPDPEALEDLFDHA